MLTGGPAGTSDVARLLATERIYTGHNVINYITLADEAADGQNGNKTIDKSKHIAHAHRVRTDLGTDSEPHPVHCISNLVYSYRSALVQQYQ